MIEFIKYILLVVGAIPLIIYPFVAIASLMGLGSSSDVDVPLFNRIMSQIFLWGTLIYPAVLYEGYWFSERYKGYGVFIALLPLLFLLLLWGSFHFMDAPPKSGT